ncbi:MAG: LamG-like jellyroll fold domain-containing protein, partial [Verrucomicrobiota bacterium]
QDSSYNVKYSTSRSPTGPFTYDPAKNPILETTDDDTVDGPGHHSILTQGEKVFIVYHRHDNPHDPDGAHRQTCISELYFDADGSIEKVQPGHLGVGYLAPSTVRDSNLAFGKSVTASSSLSSDFRAEYAVDENNGTLWKAADKSYPQWLKVDLGKDSPVRRVETEFQYPQVANRYLIESSSDGRKWQTFANRKDNTEPGVMIDRGDVRARFVRITLLGQDSGRPDQWAALWGFKVYDGIDKPNQAPLVDLGPTPDLNFRYPSVTLEGAVHDDGLPNGPVTVAWSKLRGPGTVSFSHLDRVRTEVTMDKAGTYVLKLTADDGQLKGAGTITIHLAKPTDRIVAYDFDEASGAIAKDGSGNGKNGVLRRGAIRSFGMRGRAVNLDGADDYVSISPIGALKRATIAAWINPHRLRPDMSLFCAEGRGPGSSKLTVHVDGALQFGVEGTAPQTSKFRFTPEQVGEWRHVALTYNPEAKTVAFYIDGKLDVIRTLAEAPMLEFSKPARLGGADSGARPFSGEMDEFRLYEKVLSAHQIAGLARRVALTTVAAARKLKDGTAVVLMSKPVTLADANPLSLERSTDFFYVADLDGRAGIRVEDGKTGPDKIRADACVSLAGTLRTKDNGERYIELAEPPSLGADRSAPPRPIAISQLGSALGCAVSVSGLVKQVTADHQSLVLGDDAGEIKVISGQRPIMKNIGTGNTVTIAGVVGMEGNCPVVLLRDLIQLNPAASDALAFYSFEETGETAKDSSSNRQDATLAAGAQHVSGKQGSGLQLDGEKGYLQVPDLGLHPALTVAAWLNLADYAKDTYASVLHCDSWTWGDLHWNVASDNKKMNVFLNGIGELHSRYEFTPDKLGQWVHVALTYDAGARSLKLYINGVEEAASGIQAPRAVNLSHVKIGSWEGHARMWKGAMDEIRFYNRALTSAEISDLVGIKTANR